MKIKNFKIVTSWRDVADSARTTVGMSPGDKEISSSWKKKMLLAEHSPIRQLIFKWKWVDLPSWVSVHFVRHKIGIEHFVSTQRTDRTGVNRDELPQGALVSHECIANAQALITISRKRLCNQASTETIKAWTILILNLYKFEKELWECCVPECAYRGFCPELKSCGWNNSKLYKKTIEVYKRREYGNL